MTIDDENSIYVGGLPYDCTEERLREAFDLYGAVIAVKIINDREVEGKCYGFVTFSNPRSAVDAINDMDGRTIGGRTVRVNEVRSRGLRPSFRRENFRGREPEWDRERDYGRNRDHYPDRNFKHSRNFDRERDRDFDHEHDIDLARDHALDQNRDRDIGDEDFMRNHDRDWDSDRDMGWDKEREGEKSKGRDGNRDKDREQQSRSRERVVREGRRSRELSSNSSGDYDSHVKEQLEISRQREEELQKELVSIEDKVEEQNLVVSDLQKKAQKLEDALGNARKLSSQRHSLLSDLHRCYLLRKDCTEKLKSAEHELEMLVDAAMIDIYAAEEAGERNESP